MHDYHTHSNYSDGQSLFNMVRAAEEAGLDGIGFTDHCTISTHEHMRDARAVLGFNLDITYERRRCAIEHLREKSEIEIYDAVEMDYTGDTTEIRAFLDEANFDYTIGSVHRVNDLNVQFSSNFSEKTEAELDAFVDRYFEKLIALVESELFDIAAHPDLIERTQSLRGRATENHYHEAAQAFADSRTVPEINAGRALTDEGSMHPNSLFFDILCEYDTRFAVGSDTHSPDEISDRTEFLDGFLTEHAIEPIVPGTISE